MDKEAIEHIKKAKAREEYKFRDLDERIRYDLTVSHERRLAFIGLMYDRSMKEDLHDDGNSYRHFLMLGLMRKQGQLWDFRHSECFCMFIGMCKAALQRDCGNQRLIELVGSLNGVAGDPNVPFMTRRKALTSISALNNTIEYNTEEIEVHLDMAFVGMVSRCRHGLTTRQEFQSSSRMAGAEVTNMFYNYTRIFGKYLKTELSLAMVRKITADLKSNPLAKYMVMELVAPKVASFKSLLLPVNITNPLPTIFKRGAYMLPSSVNLSFAMQWDHIDLFKLIFDIACFQGRKEVASYLLTTSLLAKSNPLWWLALTNNFQLAQQLIFNNRAVLDKMNKIQLPAENAPTIIDILGRHKNQKFIDAYMDACGSIGNVDQAQAELEKNKANDYYGKKRFKEAIECYTKAMQIHRPTHILYSNRSIAHFQLGQFQQALVDAEESLKLQPDWIKGYLRKGAALESLGRLDESIVVYQTGLKFDSKHPELLKSLEQTQHKKSKQYEMDLINSFNEVLIDPSDLNIH
eukprot:gene8989-10544_t